MPQYYDKNGNKIELPSQKEIQQNKQETEQLRRELEDSKKSLANFKNKDYNFKKLRDMSEKEVQKLTAKELEMKKWQENVETQLKDTQKTLKQSWKKQAMNVVASNMDKDTKDKFNYHYKQLMRGRTKTEETIKSAVEDAYFLATKNNFVNANLNDNPIITGYGQGSTSELAEDVKPTQSELEAGKPFNITSEDWKKYGKKINQVTKVYSPAELIDARRNSKK